jgi:hypothetical protein
LAKKRDLLQNWKIFNDDDPELSAGPFLGRFKMIPSLINKKCKSNQQTSTGVPFHFFGLGLTGWAELKMDIRATGDASMINRGPYVTPDGVTGDYGCYSTAGGRTKECTAVIPFMTPLSRLYAHISFIFRNDPSAYAFWPSFLYESASLLSNMRQVPDQQFPIGIDPQFTISAPPLSVSRQRDQKERDDFAAGRLALLHHCLLAHECIKVFCPSENELEKLRSQRRTELWQRAVVLPRLGNVAATLQRWGTQSFNCNTVFLLEVPSEKAGDDATVFMVQAVGQTQEWSFDGLDIALCESVLLSIYRSGQQPINGSTITWPTAEHIPSTDFIQIAPAPVRNDSTDSDSD